MKQILKTYGIGLLVIGIVIQPWFFGTFIGMNMGANPAMAYILSVIFEIVIIAALIFPYIIGCKILKDTK